MAALVLSSRFAKRRERSAPLALVEPTDEGPRVEPIKLVKRRRVQILLVASRVDLSRPEQSQPASFEINSHRRPLRIDNPIE